MASTTSLMDYVSMCLDSGIVPILEGAPGTGKTYSSMQIAHDRGREFLGVIMSCCDLLDAMGVPNIRDGKAEFVPFGHFEKIYTATKPMTVLFDDLGQATPSVQSSIMHIIHGRELNGHKVPDCVEFIIATNRATDRAGVSLLISPIRDRGLTIPWQLECTCNKSHVCDWHRWAHKAAIHDIVYGFVRFRPQCLIDFDVPNANPLDVCCSPRSLEYLSNAEKTGIPNPPMLAVRGLIGDRHAREYLAYRTMYKALPLLDDILANPGAAAIPDGVDSKTALLTMLAKRHDDDTHAALAQYVARMGAEWSVAFKTMCRGSK